MKLKNRTKLLISGLNQERILNEIISLEIKVTPLCPSI